MSTCRPSSYNKYFDPLHQEKTITVTLGDKITPHMTAGGASVVSIPVEMRGITLRQLRAIQVNATRRCIEEKWIDQKSKDPVSPESINMHHINHYITKPFTRISKASLVETLPSTAGTQPPCSFVIHWWGQPFNQMINCIEQMVHDCRTNCDEDHDAQGGGMTEDTPMWISAFAMNQWMDLTAQSLKSSIAKTIKGITSNRTLLILDDKGAVFSHTWCIYELYIMSINNHIMSVYTAYKHCRHSFVNFDNDDDDNGERNAVGIIPGGAPGEIAVFTSLREKYFPIEQLLHALRINIESSKSSVENDRTHILKSITMNDKSDINEADTPQITEEARYSHLNDVVRGIFATSVPVLKAALAVGENEWDEALMVFSRGIMTGTFKIDFRSFIPRLSSTQARDLVAHIPITCSGLNIRFPNHGGDEGMMESIIDWLKRGNEKERAGIQELVLRGSTFNVHKKEKGIASRVIIGTRLANALGSSIHNKSLSNLVLIDCDVIDSRNVQTWASALKKMKKLKYIQFNNIEGLSNKDRDTLHRAPAQTANVYFK